MDNADFSLPGPCVVIKSDSSRMSKEVEGCCNVGYGFEFSMGVSSSRHCDVKELESLIASVKYGKLSSIYNKLPEKYKSVEDWDPVFKA